MSDIIGYIHVNRRHVGRRHCDLGAAVCRRVIGKTGISCGTRGVKIAARFGFDPGTVQRISRLSTSLFSGTAFTSVPSRIDDRAMSVDATAHSIFQVQPLSPSSSLSTT
jgi:hypothetical protein